MPDPRALDGVRVLDLATPAAESAGRVFADLGAEVIKIEPPGGCASRRTPPFATGQEGDAEGSLYWRAFGLGKKSVEPSCIAGHPSGKSTMPDEPTCRLITVSVSTHASMMRCQ